MKVGMHTRLMAATRAVRTGLVATLALACSGVHGFAAPVDEDRAFFRNKVVRLTLGGSYGTGYDAYARLLAPEIGKRLGATVIVVAIPGAGGLTSWNLLYKADPDGLTIELANGNAAMLAQVIGTANVKYDMARFGYLASVGAQRWIWLASPKAPYRNLRDIMAAHPHLRWAGEGPTNMSDGAAVTCAALDLDCQVVRGYTAETALLAVASGEVDGVVLSEATGRELVDQRRAVPIAMLVRSRSRLFPDLPTVFETLSLTAEHQWLLDFRAGMSEIGRVLMVPPGMSETRLRLLRDVVASVLTNPSIIAEGERTQRPLEYVSGETIQKLAGQLSQTSEAEKQRFAHVIFDEYR